MFSVYDGWALTQTRYNSEECLSIHTIDKTEFEQCLASLSSYPLITSVIFHCIWNDHPVLNDCLIALESPYVTSVTIRYAPGVLQLSQLLSRKHIRTLWCDTQSAQHARVLVTNIINCSSITDLSLCLDPVNAQANNDLTVGIIADLLKHTSITSISLHMMRYKISNMISLPDSIFTLIAEHQTIKEFALFTASMTEHELRSFANAISANKTLESIGYCATDYNAQIRYQDITMLIDVIVKHPTIRSFTCSCSQILIPHIVNLIKHSKLQRIFTHRGGTSDLCGMFNQIAAAMETNTHIIEFLDVMMDRRCHAFIMRNRSILIT